MPSLQPLVITDRQATPVNRTLNPSGSAGPGIGVVALADASGAAVTERRFSIGQRRSSDRVRTTMKYQVPAIVTEVINGVSTPKVMRVAYVDMTFNFHNTHTEAERNDITGEVASMLSPSKVLVNDTVVKGQSVFGL